MSLAPYAIDMLLAQGAPAEMGEKSMLPAVDKAHFAEVIKRLQARGKGQEEIAKALGKKYGGRKAVKAMRPPSKLMSRLGVASSLGMNALFLPMALAPFFGGGEEEQLAMAMQGQGGEGDLLSMLAGLQDQAEGSRSQLRGDVAESSAAVNAMDRMDMLRARPGTLGLSRASMLEELIRGHEDELSRIAYNEPMSVAQAYAMKGLYRDEPQVNLNFGDIL
jgi:hypothetical protein